MNRLVSAFVYVSKGGGKVLDDYIEKHGRRLYGLCRTLCQNPVDADDLYQETWLKVHQKFDQYDPEYEFEGWLTRICVNIYKDQLRKKKLSHIFDLFDSQEAKDAVLESAAASNLMLISLALLALAVAPYSMTASFICLIFLGTYLSGSGILTVLLAKKLMDRHGKASNEPFSLTI